jgi:phosphoglycolate phosphatase-like HAD superfamily hydrolase
LEILHSECFGKKPVKAVLFDFDGTISTLRCGWEGVMAPLMTETLRAGSEPGEVARRVADYIDASTGIQTIFQMQWLAEQVKAQGRTPLDPWEYKAEYNRRLMQSVALRRGNVESGRESAGRYLVSGSAAFLKALKDRGISLYVASGTDQADVEREADILGVAEYFDEIAGAPPREARCSKERVIRSLLGSSGLSGEELAVIGDGKVEIAIAREAGALALGVASDEEKRRGVNPVKRQRLLQAGAHAIIGDFERRMEILAWLGRKEEAK